MDVYAKIMKIFLVASCLFISFSHIHFYYCQNFYGQEEIVNSLTEGTIFNWLYFQKYFLYMIFPAVFLSLILFAISKKVLMKKDFMIASIIGTLIMALSIGPLTQQVFICLIIPITHVSMQISSLLYQRLSSKFNKKDLTIPLYESSDSESQLV